MYILLAAATTLEIQPTTTFLEKAAFRLADHETGILITGVGSMATLYSLMRQTRVRRPDLILQAGIAGGFSKRPAAATQKAAAASQGVAGATQQPAAATQRPPGEVVTIKEELSDLGVWEKDRFKTLFDLRLAGPDTPPFSDGLLVNPYKKLLGLTGLEQVRALSVNEITTDPARIAWYQQNGSPVVESMEGAALHYACLQESIPFLQIRSISNDVGIRDKIKWDIPTAIRRLNEELTALLNKLAAVDGTILERSE